MIDRSQYPINRERVRLIRRREGLQIRKKAKKRRVQGSSSQWEHKTTHPGHVWGWDFVQDQTLDGRSFRYLAIVDEFTRENLALEFARSLTSVDVERVLTALVKAHGAPGCIRSDNGREFIATTVQIWLKDHNVGTHYINPGSPWQNGYWESFNSIFHNSCLVQWAFESVAEARAVISQ